LSYKDYGTTESPNFKKPTVFSTTPGKIFAISQLNGSVMNAPYPGPTICEVVINLYLIIGNVRHGADWYLSLRK